jgi:hypothetical protein
MKKEHAFKRQTAGEQPLIGRDRGKGKKITRTTNRKPLSFRLMDATLSVSCVIVTFDEKQL